MAGYNPLAAAIQSMMSSRGMGGGMSDSGFSPGNGNGVGMTRANDLGAGGSPVNPSGGMGSLFASIRSMMGNPLQRGGMGGGNAPGGDPWAVSRQLAGQQNQGGMADSMGGALGQSGMGGIDPNLLMMHLMNGGSLASLQQMLQARQGGGQPGGMGMAPQMNPAGGMMSAFNRTMAR